jgi:hypothetical protein
VPREPKTVPAKPVSTLSIEPAPVDVEDREMFDRAMPELIAGRYELYRVILDYEALQDGFNERIEDLNTTLEQIDLAGGHLKGYSQKTLCKPPVKRLGWESLGRMLKGTGMALVLVIDDERFAPIKARLTQRIRPIRQPKAEG